MFKYKKQYQKMLNFQKKKIIKSKKNKKKKNKMNNNILQKQIF